MPSSAARLQAPDPHTGFATPAADNTYRRLLGEAAWRRLHPNVRARFAVKPAPGEAITFIGVMSHVRRSALGWLAAQLSRLVGTPLPARAGRNVPTSVRIYVSPVGDGVVWERLYEFDERRPVRVASTKRPDGDRGLLECAAGGFAMRLRLYEKDGALNFASTGYCLDIGRWRLAIPDLLTPGHVLVVHRDEGGGWFRFTMTIRHRWCGETFFQDGLFRRAGEGEANSVQTQQLNTGRSDMIANRGVHRIVPRPDTDAVAGRVRLSPVKFVWVGGMYLGAIVGGVLTFTWEAFALFIASSALVLLTGHSVGMHRRLIHNSFDCPLWLEYLLVHAGVLVGIAGPLGMTRTHDMRDWAQRQPRCHDYYAHRQPFLIDGYWQLFCDLVLDHPPRVRFEDRIADDPVYRLMERTWMWQQLPWALLLFWLGGWPFLFWGVCARVSVCVTGHWLIGYFAHNSGPRLWHVEGAGVQGHNVPFTGLITMGEGYHNNHHAFPGSALIALEPSQVDPGWWLIKILEVFGLAWNIRTARDLPFRPELRALAAA